MANALASAVDLSPAERSRAFREASLLSEERRAIAVVLVVLMIVTPIASLSFSGHIHPQLRLVGALAGLLLIAIQVGCIAASRWARRNNRAWPPWCAVVSVAIECSVPTGVMFAHAELRTVAPHVAVTIPTLIAYAIFISLTTLRLRPWLCLWAGAVSAGGYLALVGHVWYHDGPPPEDGWPRPAYLMAIMLILACALAAAWMAREFRGHVVAALDEAESRRRLERLEADVQQARTIQQSLLPRASPRIPGYDIAGWNRPADQTGGDYYDWQELPDGRWIVSLADVSGHGLGPALVTAACRAYLRASSVHEPDLRSLISRVNQLLASDLPDGRFVTLVGVLIDATGGPVGLLSAGHGPIVLYIKSTGEVQSLRTHGLPLAIAPDAEFDSADAIQLAPGDVLALITDGVVEWARADSSGNREEFGLERLSAVMQEHAHRSASDIIAAVSAELHSFAGKVAQQDDVTLVVVRRT